MVSGGGAQAGPRHRVPAREERLDAAGIEVAAALRLVDGLCLVVDVIEGVQINTEKIIRHAVLEDIPITLIVNKVDRLIMELKLPPNDAYFKLKHTIEEVNTIISEALPGKAEAKRLSPEKGPHLRASSTCLR